VLKEKSKALIVGANGLIGNLLLREILNDPHYSEIEIWTRTSVGLQYLKLNEKIIDFDAIDKIHVSPVDHVFCCLGTTIKKAGTKEAFRKVDFEYVVQLAKYAELAGASKFFVVSSIGANKRSMNFYLRTKGEMEEAVKGVSIPSIYIFQPSLLFGKRKEFRFGEVISQKFMTLAGFLFIGIMKKYKGIQAKTIAYAMLKLAMNDKTEIVTLNSAKIQKIGSF